MLDCNAAVSDQGTRVIETLIQADHVIGFRHQKPLRRSLPKIG
jgi:hypothetical protein